ncbi:hypothetical protein SH139x_002578 [Planctomycetaceae bacterium SH139]
MWHQIAPYLQNLEVSVWLLFDHPKLYVEVLREGVIRQSGSIRCKELKILSVLTAAQICQVGFRLAD